jgi:hypothetical protein
MFGSTPGPPVVTKVEDVAIEFDGLDIRKAREAAVAELLKLVK